MNLAGLECCLNEQTFECGLNNYKYNMKGVQ